MNEQNKCSITFHVVENDGYEIMKKEVKNTDTFNIHELCGYFKDFLISMTFCETTIYRGFKQAMEELEIESDK